MFLVENQALYSRADRAQHKCVGGSTATMEGECRVLELAAWSQFPVLFLGPPRSGKLRAAIALHEASERKGQSLVLVDGASIKGQILSHFNKAKDGTLIIKHYDSIPTELRYEIESFVACESPALLLIATSKTAFAPFRPWFKIEMLPLSDGGTD